MAKRITVKSPVTKENAVALLVSEGYNQANTEALVEKWFDVAVKAHPGDNIREICFYLKHF